MQPNYLERVQETRKNTAQRQTQEQDLGAMLAELKKMQMAAMMGSGKSTVILTDQTDLGDKIGEAIGKVEKAIESMDSSEADKQLLAAMVKMQGIFDGYFKRVGNDTNSIVSAIKAMNLSPVIETPVVNVPTPQVTVPAPIVNVPAPEVHVEAPVYDTTDRTDLSRYRAHDIYESGDCQYVGFVNPEGAWYIIENDTAKNRMRYAFGNGSYARSFRQAGTYAYKPLDKAYNAQA